jgi:ABC-type glucose/galactose transport system permease subunit
MHDHKINHRVNIALAISLELIWNETRLLERIYMLGGQQEHKLKVQQQ